MVVRAAGTGPGEVEGYAGHLTWLKQLLAYWSEGPEGALGTEDSSRTVFERDIARTTRARVQDPEL
jgi:hypothetical protein